jgi:hypothetical protein
MTPTVVHQGDQWKPPLLSCEAVFADSTTRPRYMGYFGISSTCSTFLTVDDHDGMPQQP